MNTIIKLFSLVFIAFFISCSDDDKDNVENQGFLKIGEQTVNLSQAYLENYGKKGNAYNIDFTARSKSLFDANNAAVVYFEMFSSQEQDLSKGDYALSNYSTSTANTFTEWGECLLGSDITSTDKGLIVTNGIRIKPVEGIFKVIESGETYKVSFSGKGTASNYKNGVVTSTQENVSFSMEYYGNVERYKGTEFTSKNINSKERTKKNHFAILK